MDDHDRTSGWWGHRSPWGKAGFVVAILLVAFLALGAIISACEGSVESEPPDPLPTTTAIETESEPPPSPIPVPPPVERPDPYTSEPDVPETEPDVPETEASDPVIPEPSESAPSEATYYENCDAAREAGAAPLLRGEPGYRDALDREGDGIACEPYAGS
ncbi:excalibur calcium-binding domain-containing protein [Streptomyces sp. NPDC058757]|uniref:excalibur calcium-binding domain-containing protein n=1 Tax=Streptomyces sp. NPDC058757 TaxID=3346626 RepID=UPI0036AA1678